MACTESTSIVHRIPVLFIFDEDGNAAKVCCLDNFDITTNVETFTQECGISGATLKDVTRTTADANIGVYQMSAKLLPMVFPGGEITSNDGVTAVTKSVTIPSGSFAAPLTVNTNVLVNYFNADGSSLTITLSIAWVKLKSPDSVKPLPKV